MNKILLLFVSLILIATNYGCSSGSNVAGGSIEISNGYVSGVVLNSGKVVEGGVVVKLIPSNYNPLMDSIDLILLDTTDSMGLYEFTDLDSGNYNIIMRDSLNQNALLVNGLNIQSDTIDALINTLKPVGRINVDVSSFIVNADGYLYIKGTDIYVEVSSALDTVSLMSIPSGLYGNMISIDGELSNEKIVSNDLLVVADKNINLPYEFTVLMIEIDSTDMINILADVISEMGGMPIIKSSDEFITTDTTGIDLIYISYIADLEQNKIDFFRSVDIPLICSKAEYYKELGFTVGISNIYGYEENNRAIIDIDTHAITQGYFAADSSVEIYEDASSMPMMAWGSVWGSCTRIANGTLSQDHRVWFTFDAGDGMNGLNAPANRAGIAITKGRFLHESAIILFKNTVNWAISR